MTRLRIVLLAMLVALPIALGAQATLIHTSGTLPSNCTIGNVYLKTGASAGFHVCLATDTWTGPLGESADVQALLDGISTTQGVLLYYDGSDWAALAPGTSGHYLQTQGAGANPQWAAVASADIQTLLDGISTTQGVVLYYNGTDWVALSPGTSGQFLQTQGAGANPQWSSPAGSGDVVGPASSVDGEFALFDSTTGKLIKAATGSGFVTATSGVYGTTTLTSVVGITIDGAGSAITTGVKGYVRVPFACTIAGAVVLADQTGSIVIDVWKDTLANYPPTDADSITASAPPTLSSATNSEDTTLSGWTTSFSAGDVAGFNVDSASAVTRVTLTLPCVRN